LREHLNALHPRLLLTIVSALCKPFQRAAFQINLVSWRSGRLRHRRLKATDSPGGCAWPGSFDKV
jgi:hypothetical protein